MYCPKCAEHNNDGSKFCRACGEDLARVFEAMMKRPSDDGQKAQYAFKYTFLGGWFLFIAILVFVLTPPPINWTLSFSMLIASAISLSVGVSALVQNKYAKRLAPPAARARIEPADPNTNELQPAAIAKLIRPPSETPSVTDATTRHLQEAVRTTSD